MSKSPTYKPTAQDEAVTALPDPRGSYVPSGTGQWTRSRAHSYDPEAISVNKKAPKRHLSAAGLLIEAETALAVIRRKAATATADKLAKLRRDLDAKEHWIAKLKKEIESS